MTLKTKIQQIVSDPLHVVWIVGYAFLALLVQTALLEIVRIDFARFPVPSPYVIAAGWIIESGLKRFSTGIIPPADLSVHIVVVFATILSFLLAPGLLVWGLRERAIWRMSREGRKFPFGIAAGLGISCSMFFPILLLSLFGGFISQNVRNSMQEAQVEGANRDYMIHELNLVALKAQSFHALPVRDGGGGGRWMNIRRGDGEGRLTLDDVKVEASQMKRIVGPSFPISEPSYVLEVYSSDSAVVWGIARYQGESDRFTNKNGERGMGQARAMITPSTLVVRVEN